MKDPTILREEAARLIALAAEIQELADSEDREISTEESQQITEHLTEAERLQDEANRIDQIRSAQASLLREVDTPRAKPSAESPGPFAPVPATPRDHDLEARGGFTDFGEFALAARAGTPGGGQFYIDPRLPQVGAATGTMSQSIDSDGGFLVPAEFSKQIWDGLNEDVESLLDRTDSYPITGKSISFPANAETARATGSRYGGVNGYWRAEGAQMTKSKPTLREVTLTPHELYVFAGVNEELLESSAAGALNQYLVRAASQEIGWLVGDSIINGTGAGQPLGIMNSGALISVAKETSQDADTFNHNNAVKMFARLHGRSRRRGVWMYNQDVEPQLQLMAFSDTAAAGAVYTQPGTGGSPFGSLMGLPTIPIEYCATLGDLGDVILVDLGSYATAIRGGVMTASSIHLWFDYNQIAFRFRFRIDGTSWVTSAITPANSTVTQSPFVALAARA